MSASPALLDQPTVAPRARHRLGEAAIPLVLLLLFALPYCMSNNRSVWTSCVTIAIFAVMVYGVDLILSYLGEVSFGHVVFWGLGGYVTALLSTRYGFGALTTLVSTVLLAIVLAFFIGLVTLRAREFVFSLVTYALAIVTHEVVFNTELLGGSDGVVGLPTLTLKLGGWLYAADSNRALWPIAFCLLALTIYFVDRFRYSRIGQAALMVHMNPALAASLGIRTHLVRVMVLVLSAPITAAAGWLYAYQRAYVGPDMFEGYFLMLMLTAVVLFPRRSRLGPLAGVALIQIQETFFSIGGDGDKVLLGAVLVIFLTISPRRAGVALRRLAGFRAR